MILFYSKDLSSADLSSPFGLGCKVLFIITPLHALVLSPLVKCSVWTMTPAKSNSWFAVRLNLSIWIWRKTHLKTDCSHLKFMTTNLKWPLNTAQPSCYIYFFWLVSSPTYTCFISSLFFKPAMLCSHFWCSSDAFVSYITEKLEGYKTEPFYLQSRNLLKCL